MTSSPNSNDQAHKAPKPGAPKPGGPKPGVPKPGVPKPSAVAPKAAPARTPVTVGDIPANDPGKWGRIADDGTVYVKTAEGERSIGNWQAGTPEEGLRHFGAKYDNLSTEIELLEARLRANPQDSERIKSAAAQLRDELPTATVIGDIAALDRRLRTIIDHSEETREQVQADRAERREQAIAQKEKLAAEAEDIAENSTEWKAAGDRIRAILDEWKQIKGIDRTTDNALWKRYSRARDSFKRRRGAHFAELDRNRAAAREKKEELITRAEAIQDSTDWGATARAYRDLMQEWKKAGRAPREVDQKLWERFRAAQDHFFTARDAENAERDKEFADNARAKDALIAEYDSQIDPAKSLPTAKQKLRELQEKWDDIGFVPRGQIREYEDKIAAVEKRVANAEESEWRRTDPEAHARVQQFADKVSDLQAQADAAAAKGNEKKAAALRDQAAQWEQWAQTAAAAVDDQ